MLKSFCITTECIISQNLILKLFSSFFDSLFIAHITSITSICSRKKQEIITTQIKCPLMTISRRILNAFTFDIKIHLFQYTHIKTMYTSAWKLCCKKRAENYKNSLNIQWKIFYSKYMGACAAIVDYITCLYKRIAPNIYNICTYT